MCRRLKRNPLTAPIPVLLKTAFYGDETHRTQGLAAGADEYLTEPVTPALLLVTVVRLLKRAG